MRAAGMAIDPKKVTDVDIQEWVRQEYGFVPHPFWIRHCQELYLDTASAPTEPRPVWHACPPEKRLPIKAALQHFGILRDESLL